ncbi:hypothetical protein PBI_THONKO_56 [Mycobacterium phage Thonko]|uniref:Uncharacterized protein n=1 Tax=Mycobacterium phage Thonko TaxID=2282910 RepID=A0A346FCA3_9CAUD|nr:hypothetical protein I5G57_gp056 [Mycobacterium phage Thonko]AXN53328.1 hypothetical protein PBI_THONKO_56 [Mycobacterium phage Thonko]
MSVTFNRAQLIKVAEAALSAHDTAQAKYAEACEAYRADHAVEHFNHSEVAKLRDYLSKRLRKAGAAPVSRAEVRSALGVSDVENIFYQPVDDYVVKRNVEAPPKLLSPAEVTETRALLQVLKSATGDTVSANELKLLGLKNLAPVFTAAAQAASGKGAK